MMKKFIYFLITISLMLFSIIAFSHGLIEKPASREQFCGVESKPDQIYGKMTHEECRPMMTKADGSMDNSVYNFMAVLTHTTGRQGRTTSTLPKNVCGFDSENWGGSKTPWDKAINWPVNTISGGKTQFVWNISWGNHFSDTEEFAYWITKADFKFDPTKELTWNDFEDKPFCVLKYDDKNPTANPNIVPDKVNNKFTTTCTVPTRTNRAVIYGEWGRNLYTFERFHSCIDVVFSGTPQPSTVQAAIAAIPSTVTGATELTLDGSQSQGKSLSYQWSISTNDSSYYTLTDATKSIAKLAIKNPSAEQDVIVNLTVSSTDFSDHASATFTHKPSGQDTWRNIGNALIDDTLKAGDKISLRIIDANGKDYYFPSTPLVLDAESAQPANWAYYLGLAVNGKNNFSVNIGVLNAATQKIQPTRSATNNKVYVPKNSTIENAYVSIQRKEQPTTNCRVIKKSGSSLYWLGYDVYTDKAPILLDFTATGIDLSKVQIQAGVFSNVVVLSNQKLLINAKPDWVSQTTPGYIGFGAQNYAPFGTSIVASCGAG
ncbi:MAG: lytic polysaccharide monooxygenase [Gammaproteobacteria bacterium]|nr:lytic polysaccharide monooxygenase [Gammaproteobacteria bacterium]